MSDPDTPSIAWPSGPANRPNSEQAHEQGVANDAQRELADIVRIAGGFPVEPPMDAATADLLAPAGAPIAPATPEDAFQKALADGTIPSFPDMPADIAVDPTAQPADPNIEREAWRSLLAFIEKQKDPGTTVTTVDPDIFMTGF